MLGIPRDKWPIAIVMVAVLAFALTLLQRRFDDTDAKKGITAAMSWKPAGRESVFDAISKRGEGDPLCVGNVVSQLMGDVDVRCSTPAKPQIEYEFRVLLDGRKPPRAANDAAQQLVAGLH
ncbi:MAG: hypothetical protein ABR567_22590 [Myxococcales bacterium]|nr:hypothetical protein [Myxococcales bacterium]